MLPRNKKKDKVLHKIGDKGPRGLPAPNGPTESANGQMGATNCLGWWGIPMLISSHTQYKEKEEENDKMTR